jgi:hypothetical protein
MGTIDITPTWCDVVPLLVELLQHEKTRQTAIDELHNMAQCADRWNNYAREVLK